MMRFWNPELVVEALEPGVDEGALPHPPVWNLDLLNSEPEISRLFLKRNHPTNLLGSDVTQFGEGNEGKGN
jgi:hypothetical protein